MANDLNIALIDNATHNAEFKVTLSKIEEIAHCIHDCEWDSGDEIYAYMKECIIESSST